MALEADVPVSRDNTSRGNAPEDIAPQGNAAAVASPHRRR